jgi:hypothetical protein
MYRYLAIAALLLCATACGLNELDDQIIVPVVEDEFYLSLWESFSPEKRELEFRLRTIQNTDCKNASIKQVIKFFPGNIQFSINEIVQETGCEPGQAPATGTAKIGALPSVLYSLDVKLREKVTSKGQLTVSPESFDISLAKGGGIILLQSQLRRIPDQMIWGFISYQEPALSQEAQNLLQDISAQCELQSLRNGDYGYFSLQDGTLRFTNTIAPSSALTFYYHYDGTGDILRSLLESYRAAHSGKLTVKIFNTRGEEW